MIHSVRKDLYIKLRDNEPWIGHYAGLFEQTQNTYLKSLDQ